MSIKIYLLSSISSSSNSFTYNLNLSEVFHNIDFNFEKTIFKIFFSL